MKKAFNKLIGFLRDAFWLLPALMVLGGVLAAVGFVSIDRAGIVPSWLIDSAWLYNGGGTGARTLLGAVASSAIGVAGTVFSITIAALSLAAGQMGPRLLRNFTQDRGNQVTLGAFLATFSYALMVLRSVRTRNEGEFVPHLSLSVGLLLAFLCVATLVYFVGHMANRINVDTVIDLVSDEVLASVKRIGLAAAPKPVTPMVRSQAAQVIHDVRRGYLEKIEVDGLLDWLKDKGASMQLLVRPGDYVFPGAPIAFLSGADVELAEAEAAVRHVTSLNSARVSSDDLEYSIRQLVEVAVRALSPGINDPHTAMSALDRLGAALCDLAPLHLPDGLYARDGHCVLTIPAVSYQGLTDAMFNLIRQNAAGSAAVLIRMLEVLTSVASCERQAERLVALQHHAERIRIDAERDILAPSDLADLQMRYRRFEAMRALGPIVASGLGQWSSA